MRAKEHVRRLLRDLGDEADAEIAFVAGRLAERKRARRAERRDQ